MPENYQRRNSELQRRESEQLEPFNEMSKLTETEEAAVGTVSWALYGRYFKRMGLGLSISSSLTFFLFLGANVYSNGECKDFKFFLLFLTL